MKLEPRETPNSMDVTSSENNLGDADDIVSEFLGQINRAPADVVSEVRGYSPGHCLHNEPHKTMDNYGRLPVSFAIEPDSKLHSYASGGGDLLPGSGTGDMGGGPAAETLKKMAALHRRLEQKTGCGSENTFDYTSGYGDGRHALNSAPYQLPVSYCTGSSRGGAMYAVGASKPLSHYPASTAVITHPAALSNYGHQRASELDSVGGSGSLCYMSQSQCVDFRLSHPGVQARAIMSQSAAVRSSPYRVHTPSSAAGQNRAGYPYPHPRYHSTDDHKSWNSSHYGRPEQCSPSVEISGNGSENRKRVFHAYRGSKEQSFSQEGGLQPPPPYCDFVRQKHRLQFDQKYYQPRVNKRWMRHPWTSQHDHVYPSNPNITTPAPTAISGHVTSSDVTFPINADEVPLSQEYLLNAYCSSNVTVDNIDFSFIDNIFSVP